MTAQSAAAHIAPHVRGRNECPYPRYVYPGICLTTSRSDASPHSPLCSNLRIKQSRTRTKDADRLNHGREGFTQKWSESPTLPSAASWINTSPRKAPRCPPLHRHLNGRPTRLALLTRSHFHPVSDAAASSSRCTPAAFPCCMLSFNLLPLSLSSLYTCLQHP